MNGSGGAPGNISYLLSSTNAALPLSNWTRISTNYFDLAGRFSLTNAADTAAARMFYRLQQP